MTTFTLEKYFQQYIYPTNITNKDELYGYLLEIHNSFTERTDVFNIANIFILEAAQLLANSIFLFENGYFDAAFYSIRQSIEMATIMLYLSDPAEYEKKKELFSTWKLKQRFPMTREILEQLKKFGDVVKNMNDLMPTFFEDIDKLCKKLNKIVHKQGLDYCFTTRIQSINKNSYDLSSEFNNAIKKTIGIVAIMRLAIDPIPIAIRDEEILNRIFETSNQGFSDDFVNNFIGKELLLKYKQTDIYREFYEDVMLLEKRFPETTAAIQTHYIDTQKIGNILSQQHLLKPIYKPVIQLFAINQKFCKAHCYDGLITFFSDRISARKSPKFNSKDIMAFELSKNRYNQQYEEVFISVFNINNELYCMEHNEKLTDSEINNILSSLC